MSSLDVPLSGRCEPPLENGEIVFAEPWQGRVFGVAVRLAEEGVVEWADFQQMLISVIGEWDADHPNGLEDESEYPYFEMFAEALSRLLIERGVVSDEELVLRDGELAARPHGHDH